MSPLDAGHPESYCHRCKGPNRSWYTQSPIWNRVMRPVGEASEQWSIICPTCFMVLAEKAGLTNNWEICVGDCSGIGDAVNIWTRVRDAITGRWMAQVEALRRPESTVTKRVEQDASPMGKLMSWSGDGADGAYVTTDDGATRKSTKAPPAAWPFS